MTGSAAAFQPNSVVALLQLEEVSPVSGACSRLARVRLSLGLARAASAGRCQRLRTSLIWLQAAAAGARDKVRVAPAMTLAHMTQLIMPQHANSLGITFGGQVLWRPPPITPRPLAPSWTPGTLLEALCEPSGWPLRACMS